MTRPTCWRSAPGYPAAPPAQRQSRPGPPALLVPHPGRCHLPLRARPVPRRRPGQLHADPQPTPGAGPVTRAGRCRHACRDRLAGQPASARVRLRARPFRRDSRREAGRPRLPGGPGQDRTVRRNLMVLDGNAIGGLLQELFGTDMTDAEATCATCVAAGPVAETVVYLRGPGTVVRCRNCSGTLMVISQIRGHELRRCPRPERALPRPGWLTSEGGALVRSGRPIRRVLDASATRTPGIHAGPGTRRRQPSPPLPGPQTGPTTRLGRTDRDRSTGRRPTSASPGQPVPGMGGWYVTWVQRRRTASRPHHQERQVSRLLHDPCPLVLGLHPEQGDAPAGCRGRRRPPAAAHRRHRPDTVGLVPGSRLDVDDTCMVRAHEDGWLYALGDVNRHALLTHQRKYQARITGRRSRPWARSRAWHRRQLRPPATAPHRGSGRRL